MEPPLKVSGHTFLAPEKYGSARVIQINRNISAVPILAPLLQEITMKLLTDLFTTDYGIMSISGIGFMLGMAVFFIWYFNHKMNEAAGDSSK
jgi:hypothetical protein